MHQSNTLNSLCLASFCIPRPKALHTAVKRREAKSNGEKERYKHLNAEFQRIARRDKKAFLSDHCKEIEENNRMGKTRDLFKEIRDTKGTFHAKMGSIKERNGMDLAEAEDIKKKVILFAIILFKNFRIVYNKPIFLYFQDNVILKTYHFMNK